MLVNHIACLGIIPVTSDHLPPGRLRDHKHLEGVEKRSVGDTHRERVIPYTPHYSVEENQLIVEEVQELLNNS